MGRGVGGEVCRGMGPAALETSALVPKPKAGWVRRARQDKIELRAFVRDGTGGAALGLLLIRWLSPLIRTHSPYAPCHLSLILIYTRHCF